jgi:hypothetical protein
MSDQQEISYDRAQLKQSGDGYVTASGDGQAHMNTCQSQIDSFGEWWNPNNDPNDIIGGLLGGCFTAVHQLMMSSGQQNLEALHGHGRAMQAMSGNMTGAEDVNAGLTKSV